jgi:hypothetical protein
MERMVADLTVNSGTGHLDEECPHGTVSRQYCIANCLASTAQEGLVTKVTGVLSHVAVCIVVQTRRAWWTEFSGSLHVQLSRRRARWPLSLPTRYIRDTGRHYKHLQYRTALRTSNFFSRISCVRRSHMYVLTAPPATTGT